MNSMDSKDIYRMLAKGERLTLECKKAQHSVPSSLWETYAAFANSYGGTILLGVSEDPKETDFAKRFTVTGVADAEKICTDLWNIVNSREKVSVNLLKDDDVQTIAVDGKRVVVVTVPRADYLERPVYINNDLARGTYKRNREGDYRCREHELRMMLRDANEAGNDNLFLEHYTMDDIDLPTLESYRVMFQTNNPEHVWNGLEHREFLRQLGGYTENRRTRVEGLTMAGLLMFGKGLPIRERFDNLRMDYIDRSHLVGDQRYSDRLTYDGTWENNLFNFVRLVLPKLTRDLPRPFRMEGVIRHDDTLQRKALREALTNAIIHADFMLNGILKVEKYDDSFVLTNPGLLLLPAEQIYAGGESKARNQRIQNMFRMIGFGENLGSGFPLLLSAWKACAWPTPELVEQPELMQVKLVLRVVPSDTSSLDRTSDDETKDELINEPINEPKEDVENQQDGYTAHGESDDLKVHDEPKGEQINEQINEPKEPAENQQEGRMHSGEGSDLKVHDEPKGEQINEQINEPINEQINGASREAEGAQMNASVTLTPRQTEILRLLSADGSLSFGQLSTMLVAESSVSTVRREIEALRTLGYIDREGSRKTGRWIVHRPV